MNLHSVLIKEELFATFFPFIFAIFIFFFPLPPILCHTPTLLISQQCQFDGVATLLVCIFYPLSPFPFVNGTLCAALFSYVPPLFSSTPPPPLRLTSIITALDSSSDGKCFSIPLSPSLSLNLRRSSLFSPSKLHLGYYRDVFIECFFFFNHAFLLPPQAPVTFFFLPRLHLLFSVFTLFLHSRVLMAISVFLFFLSEERLWVTNRCHLQRNNGGWRDIQCSYCGCRDCV